MIKKNSLFLYFGVILLFLWFSFFGFRVPENHFVAGGDFYQLTNYGSLLERYQYAWIQQVGQGGYNPLFVAFPYYAFLSALSVFFSSHLISSWILFGFLLSSFVSFLFSIKILISKITDKEAVFVSFLYGTNAYVVTIFAYPWGFTHHFIIYIFLPLLVSTYINFLMSEKNFIRNFLFLLVAFILSIPSYNNASFFALVLLAQTIVTVPLILFKNVGLDRIFFFKAATILVMYTVLSFGFFFPVVQNVLQSKQNVLKSQAALGGENYLEAWISNTSSNFLNTMTFSLDNYRYPFFQSEWRPLTVILGSFYALLLIFLLYKKRKALYSTTKMNRVSMSLLVSFSVVSLLSVRFYGPVTDIVKPLYLSPFFIFFRSPEKIFALVPLFYTFTVAYLLHSAKLQFEKLLYIILVFLISTPFVFGFIQRILVNDYNQFTKKEEPDYTYIVDIPKEYRDAREIINSSGRETAIVSLPYSVVNSVNWSNYPKWNFVGHDILHTLYNKRYISANTYDHPESANFFSFLNLNEATDSGELLLTNLQRFGAEYVFMHKDIEASWHYKSQGIQNSLNKLVETNQLSIIQDNEYFTLYRLYEQDIVPIIRTPNAITIFKKVNPTLYMIAISSENDTDIEFLQSYHKGWKLYELDFIPAMECESQIEYSEMSATECISHYDFSPAILKHILISKPSKSDHVLCKEYANCWNIANTNGQEKYYLLYFTYQNYVYIQLFSVFLGSLVSVGLLSIIFKRHE